MKNEFESVKRAIDPRLSAEERDTMRASFHTYLDTHPARPALPTRSPYYPALRYASYAFMAFIAISAPVVYAAEYSLPNDTLYPLKTYVIEPAYVGVVAWSPEAEADAHTAIVERRLKEAETLAARDELDADGASVLVASITDSVEEIRTHIAERSEAKDYDEALDAGSDVETVLEAHERVLTDIAGSATAAEDDFIDQVAAIGNDAEDYNEQVEEEQRVESDPDEGQLEALRTETKEAIATLTEGLSTDTPDEDAQALLTQASATFADAEKFASENADDEALSRMREALETATQGTIVLESAAELTDAAD